MGESHHTRNMEWNHTGEVWPVPVECLLNNINGMNTHSISDAHHLMFGNGTHMPFPHFRHRFQPPVHLPPTHLGPLPLNVNVSIPIPQHSMLTGQVENSEVSQDNCQDPQHSIPQSIPLDNSDVVLDETDDASEEEDDDEDEEDDEEDEEEDVTMSHTQQHGSLVGMTHSIDNDNNLVQCNAQVPNPLQQPTIIPMETSCQVQQQQHHQCLQQQNKQTNMNIIQHRLNGHSQSHSPLQPQPPPQQQQQSMNSFRMSDDFTLQNENNDPNSGFSVQGKMYFEGRVVLHLKQWADSPENNLIGANGNMFSSCAEQQQQQQKVHGCAVCRLKSPASQESRRSQKEAHRHTVKGVLFTFEDCIIVELYPESPPPPPSTNTNNSGLTPKPQQPNVHTASQSESQTKDHTNPTVAPYMNTISIQTQEEEDAKKFIVHHNNNNNMEHMSCLGNQQQQQQVTISQNITGQKLAGHHINHPNHPSHTHSEATSEDQWWNEFTATDELKQQGGPEETDDDDDDDNDGTLNSTSSCIENLEDNENSNTNHRNNFKMKPQKCSSSTTISATSISADNNDNCSRLLLPNSSQVESQSLSCPRNHQHQQNCNASLNIDLSSELSSNIHNSNNEGNNNNTSTIISDGKERSAVCTSSSSLSSSSSSSPDIFQIEESQNSCTSTLSSDRIVNEKLNQNSCSQMEIVEDSNYSTNIVKENTSNAVNGSSTSSSSKLRFSCPVCDRKKFQFKKLLKQHLEEIHFQTNPLYCLHCNQQFTEEKRFINHPCNIETPSQLDKTSISFGKIFSKTISNNNNNSNTNKNNNNSCTSNRKENQKNDSNIENESETDDKTQENRRESTKVHSSSSNKNQKLNTEPKSSTEKIRKQNKIVQLNIDRKSKRKSTVIHLSNSSSSTERNVSENSKKSKDDKNGVKIKSPSNSKNNKQLLIKDKSERPFKCEICNKQFKIRRRLQNHMLSHSVERSSQCEKCGKRFSRKDKLIRHMYVHATEKSFSCDICQKRFSRRDKLSDHLKSHGGVDEIHNCPMCQKQFLRPDILKQHVKLHTMGNKHQCTECLRFVTGKGRLEKHMDRHKEAKASGQTLLCPLCTKYFIQKQSLKAHFKKFHPDSNINLDNAETDFQQHQQQEQQHQTQKCESISEFQQQEEKQQQLQCNSKPPNLQTKLDINHVENKLSKEFECNLCHKQFLRKQTLKKHLRKHHAQQQQQQHCLILNHSRINSEHIENNTYTPSPVTNNTTTSPEHEQDNNSLTINLPSSSTSPAHILSSTLAASSPVHAINNNNPTMVSSVQNLTQSCTLNPSHLHQHGTLSNSHLNQHHILPAHTAQGVQISSMSHATNHTHLGQHLTVPTMSHQLNTQSINQSMCNSSSSYVLAYPQYSYQ